MPHSRSHSRKRRNATPQQIARTRKRHLLLLLLITLLTYLSALPGNFVWNDQGDLVQGEHRLTGLHDIDDALTLPRSRYRERFDGGAPDLNHGTWQPLAILANSVSWTLWGDCASCWHMENLLLHLLVVVALYALGRHLLSQRRHGNGMAFWAAALFAVHPGTVSNVAWIGGRPVLIATALGVLSLLLFSRLPPTTNVPRRHVRRWVIGSSVAAFLAMLSHESAYLLPGAILLIALLGAQERGRGYLRGVAPLRWRTFGIVVLALAVILIYRQFFVGGLNFAGSYPTDSLTNNLGTALRHFWAIVEQALLPHEPVISDAWEISYGWDAGEVAALLGTILLLGATIAGLKWGHPTALGVAWFLLWVAPGVGLLPGERYHDDQFLYVAIWGLMFSLVFIVTQIWRPVSRQLLRGSEAIIFAPVLIVLMVVSGLSNARWWHHESLFQSELGNDPHYIEGRLQLARHAIERQQPAVALNHLLTAMASREDKKFTGYWDAAEAFRLLGRTQLMLELHDDALGSLEQAVAERAHSASSWHLLGQAQLHIEDFKAAEASLRQAQKIFPSHAIEADLGVAMLGLNKSQEGLLLLTRALAHNGTSSFLRHSALGIQLVGEQQFEQARPHLEKALTYRETANTRAALALAQWQQGDTEAAHENLSIAMQLDEGHNAYVDRIQTLINGQETSSKGN